MSWCSPGELDLNGTPLAGYRLELMPVRRGRSTRAGLSLSHCESPSYVAVADPSATAQMVAELCADTTYRVRLALLYTAASAAGATADQRTTGQPLQQQSGANQCAQTEFSECVECATLAEAPQHAPQPIVLLSALPTALTLQWPDVGAGSDGCDREAKRAERVEAADAGFRFGDLANDEVATLGAGGHTRGLAIGRSEEDEREPEPEPPALKYELEVAELACTNGSSSAALLDELQATLFREPQLDSRPNNRPSAFFLAHTGPEHSYRVTKLTEARQYACRVRSVSEAGASPWSALHVFATSVALPSQLKGVWIIPLCLIYTVLVHLL